MEVARAMLFCRSDTFPRDGMVVLLGRIITETESPKIAKMFVNKMTFSLTSDESSEDSEESCLQSIPTTIRQQSFQIIASTFGYACMLHYSKAASTHRVGRCRCTEDP